MNMDTELKKEIINIIKNKLFSFKKEIKSGNLIKLLSSEYSVVILSGINFFSFIN